MSASSSSGGVSGSDDTSSKIADLQTKANSLGQIMISNGKIIQTKQKVSTKSLKSMNTMSKTYQKNAIKIQKQLDTQSTEQSKVIQVAEKMDKVFQTISQVGQALKVGGQALIALGSATSWCGVGAALVSAGSIMMKAGNVVELVGNYGTMAANITKTAAYAAEGNLAGALASAGTAIQSGAAAVKGTQDFSKNMEAINKQAENATKNIAANAAAKDLAKTEQAQELMEKTGMSEAAFKKDVKAQMMENGISGDSAKEMKANAFNNAIDNNYTANADAHFTNAKDTLLQDNAKLAGKTKKLARKANKMVKNAANNDIGKVNQQWASQIPKTTESKWLKSAQQLGTALSSAGAQMQQFDNMSGGTGSGVGYVGHRLTNPARTKQVIANINKRRYGGPIG